MLKSNIFNQNQAYSELLLLKAESDANIPKDEPNILEDQSQLQHLFSDQEKQEIVSPPKFEKVQTETSPPTFNNSITTLIHLCYAKSGETIKGKHFDQKEATKLVVKASEEGLTEHVTVSATTEHNTERTLDSLMHLIVPKGNEEIAGTKEKTTKTKNNQEETRLVNDSTLDQNVNQGGSEDLALMSMTQKSWKGVIASMLIKEEPPYISNQQHTRGKLLNPQLIRKSNLTSLYADSSILRTKFSQGRGYDEDIKTNSTRGSNKSVTSNSNIQSDLQPTKKLTILCTTRAQTTRPRYTLAKLEAQKRHKTHQVIQSISRYKGDKTYQTWSCSHLTFISRRLRCRNQGNSRSFHTKNEDHNYHASQGNLEHSLFQLWKLDISATCPNQN